METAGKEKKKELYALENLEGVAEYIKEYRVEHMLAGMLAWTGALLAWISVDAARSLTSVVLLWRDGWPWSEALETFQPPTMAKYFGMNLSDGMRLMADDKEYEQIINIHLKAWVGALICVCLSPIYCYYLVPFIYHIGVRLGVRSPAKGEGRYAYYSRHAQSRRGATKRAANYGT